MVTNLPMSQNGNKLFECSCTRKNPAKVMTKKNIGSSNAPNPEGNGSKNDLVVFHMVIHLILT